MLAIILIILEQVVLFFVTYVKIFDIYVNV